MEHHNGMQKERSHFISSNEASELAPGAIRGQRFHRGWMLAVVGVLLVWSYWPTLTYLLERWWNVPDDSHGFLVIPLSILFLWARRDSRPPVTLDGTLPGLVVVVLALTIRIAGAVGRFCRRSTPGR